MKHRLFKLAIFLLLGAVVNIAVAWGCAMTIDVSGRDANSIFIFRYIYPDHSSKKDALILRRYSKPGAIRLYLFYGRSMTPSDSRVLGQPENLVPNWAQDQLMPWKNDSTFYSEEDRVRRLLVRQADARGWPVYSVWCVRNRFDQTEDGIRLPDRWTSQHDRKDMRHTILPYRPIWPGFAINTILYSVLLWLLTLAPFTAHRMIRRKRGHCIKCGYDLRGHSGGSGGDVCPECGNTITAPN